MHLYLIRHAETIDNIAHLYAGSRDSPLTHHGVEQTLRLGQHFAQQGVRFTHIFSSPLSRAFKTAGAIREAQGGVDVVVAGELRERDFGGLEGRGFNGVRIREGENGVEGTGALDRRVDGFLEREILPLLLEGDGGEVVAVVAHGVLLAHFWRRLLLRLPRERIRVADEVVERRGGVRLEYVGGWSNTGYMELVFERGKKGDDDKAFPKSLAKVGDSDGVVDEAKTLPTPVPPTIEREEAAVAVVAGQDETGSATSSPRILSDWSTTILAIDSTVHLFGLKRQKGGIGSLAYDEGQRKLDSFFKKPEKT